MLISAVSDPKILLMLPAGPPTVLDIRENILMWFCCVAMFAAIWACSLSACCSLNLDATLSCISARCFLLTFGGDWTRGHVWPRITRGVVTSEMASKLLFVSITGGCAVIVLEPCLMCWHEGLTHSLGQAS